MFALLALPLVQANADDASAATMLLRERSEHLKPTVTRVAKSVYCASGFSPANVSMIVGKTGVVIVDTGMFPSHARTVLNEFRKISDLPIKGIILTHGHGDHTGGISVFLGDGESKPAVFALSPFNTEGGHFNSGGITINGLRGARQGGFRLPPEKRINNGIAPAVYPPKNRNVFTAEQPAPSDVFHDGRLAISVGGLELELVAAPGETGDQLYVWYPSERVVFAGDNFYQSWPNIYAIRGTAYRDVKSWIESLEKMLAEKPAHVVPGHTRPVIGEEQTIETLTNYRDAIRYVFDETIAGINRGMTPNELVQKIKLPAHLAELDYLREYYGNIEWAVRAIFTGYLGWFDGNPSNLFSLPPSEEARHMADLAGGVEPLRGRAKKALLEKDAQWCAQLCDHLMAIDPTDVEAMLLKASALELLAENLLTATGRNYYLTVAMELRKRSNLNRGD